MPRNPAKRVLTMLGEFIGYEAIGGLVLLAATVLALLVANSGLGPAYFQALHLHYGPLSVLHWINDGLMTLFFLLVGLEIKHEMYQGELATRKQRLLPLAGAVGGMLLPAAVYLGFTRHDQVLSRGWAIPAATDIAFALGVLALLGPRVPSALKTYLAALAIFDDLGAILIIAFFYSQGLAWTYLGLATGVGLALLLLNRRGVAHLPPYLGLGFLLWFALWRAGIHPTLAGVLLAFAIPMSPPGCPDSPRYSPLHRLEDALDRAVPFVVVPLFGFANAGVSLDGFTPAALLESHSAGIVLGLLMGKVAGVFGVTWLVVRSGRARLPGETTWMQFLGIAFLCGIGFTMSIFISLLAFPGQPSLVETAKLAVLVGSVLAGTVGAAILWSAGARPSSTALILREPTALTSG